MIILLDSCKGTNKRAQYKTKKEFFVFIVEREYFRALLKGTNKRAKNQIYLSFFRSLPTDEQTMLSVGQCGGEEIGVATIFHL